MLEKLIKNYCKKLLDSTVAVSYRNSNMAKLMEEHIICSLNRMSLRQIIEEMRCNNLLHMIDSADIIRLYQDQHYIATYDGTWKSIGLPFERVDHPEKNIYKVANRYFEVKCQNIWEIKPVTKTIIEWEKV